MDAAIFQEFANAIGDVSFCDASQGNLAFCNRELGVVFHNAEVSSFLQFQGHVQFRRAWELGLYGSSRALQREPWKHRTAPRFPRSSAWKAAESSRFRHRWARLFLVRDSNARYRFLFGCGSRAFRIGSRDPPHYRESFPAIAQMRAALHRLRSLPLCSSSCRRRRSFCSLSRARRFRSWLFRGGLFPAERFLCSRVLLCGRAGRHCSLQMAERRIPENLSATKLLPMVNSRM